MLASSRPYFRLMNTFSCVLIILSYLVALAIPSRLLLSSCFLVSPLSLISRLSELQQLLSRSSCHDNYSQTCMKNSALVIYATKINAKLICKSFSLFLLYFFYSVSVSGLCHTFSFSTSERVSIATYAVAKYQRWFWGYVPIFPSVLWLIF